MLCVIVNHQLKSKTLQFGVCFLCFTFLYQVFAKDGEKLKKLVLIYLPVRTKSNLSKLTATLRAEWLKVLIHRQKAKGIQQGSPCSDSERYFVLVGPDLPLVLECLPYASHMLGKRPSTKCDE